MRLHDALYWLKCWLWRRYNRITVKTLPVTWTDRCEFLPHVMFQVLADFVEREKIDEVVNWNSDSEHAAARAKMDELLIWWREEYLPFDEMEGYDAVKGDDPLRFKEVIASGSGVKCYRLPPATKEQEAFFAEVHRKEEAMNAALASRMKELVDLRPWLWT